MLEYDAGQLATPPAGSGIRVDESIEGKLVTGVGNFSFWIEKLQDHYRNKTGMQLFPSTLNIEWLNL